MSLDATFIPDVNSYTQAIAVQTDGKILIAGEFTVVNSVSKVCIARLNSDGSLDTSFSALLSYGVNSIVIQSDGRILVGGRFTTVNGVTRYYLARLTSTGATDNTFTGYTNGYVHSIIVQPDNKILIGGEFTTVNGVVKNHIARLTSTGSLDTSFTADADRSVHAMYIQSDGKLLIGGKFNTVNGTTKHYIARLTSNGGLDNSFAVTSINGYVYTIEAYPNNRFILGGTFTQVDNTAQQCVTRVHSNGNLDTEFNNVGVGALFGYAWPTAVYDAVVQLSGKVIFVGSFNSIGTTRRNYIARITPDGILDPDFNPDLNWPGSVLLTQTDGKLLIGGKFNIVNGETRTYIARWVDSETASGPNTIVLTWQDNNIGEDGSRIEQSINGIDFTQIATVGPGTTSYVITGVGSGQERWFRVRAYQGEDNSSYSNIVYIQCSWIVSPTGLKLIRGS